MGKHIMLLLSVIALSMAVQAEGDRCGEDYPIMCQDPPICWPQVENMMVLERPTIFQEFACDGQFECVDGSDEGKEEVKILRSFSQAEPLFYRVKAATSIQGLGVSA